jgi:hypothetical protein
MPKKSKVVERPPRALADDEVVRLSTAPRYFGVGPQARGDDCEGRDSEAATLWPALRWLAGPYDSRLLTPTRREVMPQ